MECTNPVDIHQPLCPWFTVVFVLFCIYTPDNLFSRPIVNQGGGLFWILSDSNVSLEEQIWLTECIYVADYFKNTEWNVFFNHMVGMKTTGEQISILCHNGTIFDKPREKTALAIKARWSPRESKIDLRLGWQSVLGTDCRGYICKIVRIRQ
jgi:hypothetical protein